MVILYHVFEKKQRILKSLPIYDRVCSGDFMKKRLEGSILLLLTTTIWGFAFVAQSVGMDKIGPFTFQAVRCLLAVLFLAPCSLIFDKLGKRSFRDSMTRWRDPKLWKTGLICGLALFVAASLQQVGLVYTDAGKAGFITAMYIVLVPILGIFLKQKLPKTAIPSVAIAVIGLYLLSCMGVSEVNRGDIYLMLSALAFAVQIQCIGQLAQDMDGLRLNCVQCLIVSLLSAVFMGATETVIAGDILACWTSLLFAGILSMGVAYTMQIVAQKVLEPTTASLIMSLESVFAAIGGWAILHEQMTRWELLGASLVFGAVLLSQVPEGLFKVKTSG